MSIKKEKNKIVKNVLKRDFGFFWFLFLIQTSLKSKKIIKMIKKEIQDKDEAKFLESYAIVPALYENLKTKFNSEKAYEIMHNIVVPAGCIQQKALLNETGLSDEHPMEKLTAFNNLMDTKGATHFNDRRYVVQNETICHFKIKRCVYKDFFELTETPELTKLFCEVDKEFFIPSFPKFRVHRGSSWENTLAFGKNECDFIFELKDLN